MHPMRAIISGFMQRHEGLQTAILTELSYLRRKIDMADANLDAIVAGLSSLQATVTQVAVAAGANNTQMTALVQELAGLSPNDPRAAQIVSQVQAMNSQLAAVASGLQAAVSSVSNAAGATGASAASAGATGVTGPTGATAAPGATGATA